MSTSRRRSKKERSYWRGEGGGKPAHLEGGFYAEPTLFVDVEPQSTIAQEKIFGPVRGGVGRENGLMGFEEYLEAKVIAIPQE